MGSLPAKSAMKSNEPALEGGVEVLERRWPGSRSSIAATLRRGEALADQRAHPGVAGRVEGQERHGPVGVGPEGAGVEGDPEGVGEAVDVAEGGQHVLVARQGPEVELVVAVDRRLGPQAGIGRVGVLVDLVGVGAVVTGSTGSVVRSSGRVTGVRPSDQRAAASASEVGDVDEAACGPCRPHSMAPSRRGSSTAHAPVGSTPGPRAAASRRWSCGADPDRAGARRRGSRPSRADGAGVDQGRVVGGEQDHVPARVALDPLGQRHRRRRRRPGGSASHAAPQHLGQQVVLRAEVGVGGGRGHPGPPGHVAHGQPGVADLLAPRRRPRPPAARPPRPGGA